jgi:copper chaperone
MTYQLQVPSMACSACVDTITQAVLKVDAAATIEADTQTKAVTVMTEQPEAVVRAAISGAGYPVN